MPKRSHSRHPRDSPRRLPTPDQTHQRHDERAESCRCLECDKSFGAKSALARHMAEQHQPRDRFPCPFCDIIYGRKNDLARHIRWAHTGNLDVGNQSPVSVSNSPKAPKTPKISETPEKKSGLCLELHPSPDDARRLASPQGATSLRRVLIPPSSATVSGQSDEATGKLVKWRRVFDLYDEDSLIARITSEEFFQE
ncbi:transcription factor Sp9-like [Patiria miniata]|uniref:C2H2-type domain-containing protein n=1 Tax=Patiria miniata TaxID=46514 RepID=A0A914ADG7_PATMI|nr:transcription factor Sp9-like [Patiria miniata]